MCFIILILSYQYHPGSALNALKHSTDTCCDTYQGLSNYLIAWGVRCLFCGYISVYLHYLTTCFLFFVCRLHARTTFWSFIQCFGFKGFLLDNGIKIALKLYHLKLKGTRCLLHIICEREGLNRWYSNKNVKFSRYHSFLIIAFLRPVLRFDWLNTIIYMVTLSLNKLYEIFSQF